ncbi:Bax inhibitor-1/YccA family protein [Candidatus Riesia pediculicola]|uniref:Stationary phase anti-death Family n=1 Tax=Riesia pediculicola (strain USDA) TaxID=515618 RepID=D4G8Z1_RIEPU|nr:Bax inhibitor-1/YccA family protein [Candidatus Riesia pediculicola]ADD79440.1 stationary phase anti-death Family [Candidatus Riesia pediculicola USDA]ARC54000.1 hypothetical protein AOE55_02505 [Candidatus Riesia pediculicola]QOJ86626.1 Bax inhibitor-1/YccA family protein [Candidatus Riesia pediculicola]
MNQVNRRSESLLCREKTGVQFYIANVYGWMSVSLLLTAFVSFYTIRNDNIIFFILNNKWIFFLIFFAEIILVNILTSSALHKIDSNSATTLLMLYSLMTGITISLPLFVYTGISIVRTFFITSIMFGALAIYGYKTKKSLNFLSSFLFTSIIGIVLISFLNIWLKNTGLSFFINFAGVLTFSGLVAYDNQKLKEMGSNLIFQNLLDDKDNMKKHSVVGALTLYLDFVNLFLFFLQINGERK